MANIQVATALHIFKYDTPVVPLQQGVVWRVDVVFKLAHEIDSLQKLDVMMARVNSIDGEVQLATFLMHKAMILLKQVDEITRACQLAKASVVNTNLLDQKEVETLLAETRSLPYQNVVDRS